jgi:hypothetical protein
MKTLSLMIVSWFSGAVVVLLVRNVPSIAIPVIVIATLLWVGVGLKMDAIHNWSTR